MVGFTFQFIGLWIMHVQFIPAVACLVCKYRFIGTWRSLAQQWLISFAFVPSWLNLGIYKAIDYQWTMKSIFHTTAFKIKNLQWGPDENTLFHKGKLSWISISRKRRITAFVKGSVTKLIILLNIASFLRPYLRNKWMK